ncbi:MAG: hypothetical protein BEV12_01320 [Microcystis aeruginosa CACIAM 03]|nr:MAG: hypothetical protein BEV12_01320 [Microcystis aeruginosa CACIAM 03]
MPSATNGERTGESKQLGKRKKPYLWVNLFFLVVLTALSIPLKRKKKGETRNNLMVGSEVEKTFSLPNILRFV